MSNPFQTFLVTATQTAVTELITALSRIPEEKRDWVPEGKARTALDQVAECAILNGYTAELIHAREWLPGNFDAYSKDKADAAVLGTEKLTALLQQNAERVVAAIQAVPDDALSIAITLPWKTQPLSEILAYPYWNMTYHLGQINYIAAMLGCLD